MIFRNSSDDVNNRVFYIFSFAAVMQTVHKFYDEDDEEHDATTVTGVVQALQKAPADESTADEGDGEDSRARFIERAKKRLLDNKAKEKAAKKSRRALNAEEEEDEE